MPAGCRTAPGGFDAVKWRAKMFARENCSKVGCFLEAALPLAAPSVALVWMLSIAAFLFWAM